MSKLAPTGITADRATARLTIGWSDGQEHSFPFDLLRNACPCAQCRGGHENMGPTPDEDVFTIPLLDVNITKLENIEAVGNYAISITWGDGHSHGIYNWQYLYTLGERMLKENK